VAARVAVVVDASIGDGAFIVAKLAGEISGEGT
jgi:hypothetical protein